MFKDTKLQTPVEEMANAATHAVGIALSISALVLLVVFAASQGSVYKVVSSVLFGCSLVILYSASTLYHSFRAPHLKKFFKILDHSAIYLLIAGTYTPLTLVSLHGAWGWSLFGVVWGLALAGVCLKVFFVYRFPTVSTVIYLLMGWLAIIAIKPLCHDLAVAGLLWLALGGLCYTLGVVFYIWKRLLFSHAIWHLFVLAGSACHFFAVLFFVIPK